MAKQTTSIKVVLDNVLTHPLLQDVSIERAIAYTLEFMKLVGHPTVFENKVATITIANYRAILPDDFYEMNQVRVTSTKKMLRYTTDTFHMANSNNLSAHSYYISNHQIFSTTKTGNIILYYVNQVTNSSNITSYNNVQVTLTLNNYSAILPADFADIIKITDTTGNILYSQNYGANPTLADDTYKIQGNIIYTTFQFGDIDISYQAISLDNDGYPMIPDDAEFIRALELYIKKKWFTILFDMGKINGNVLSNTQQEYAWAVGACQSEFNRLTIDQMESLVNSLTTLIQKTTEHGSGFRFLGNQEFLKNH